MILILKEMGIRDGERERVRVAEGRSGKVKLILFLLFFFERGSRRINFVYIRVGLSFVGGWFIELDSF